MLRELSIAAAVLVAVAAGVASASLVTPGTASEPLPGGRDELPAGTIQRGDPVADPRGGQPWAVRVYDGDSAWRCIVAGRTDGDAFGPVDASGEIHDTGAVSSGSCADPGDEPLQLGLARFADSAGTGPRSVLFGIAATNVARVELVEAGARRPVALDDLRTFAIVSAGLAEQGAAEIVITLRDGSLRTYRL
jgi:hypothetical protein